MISDRIFGLVTIFAAAGYIFAAAQARSGFMSDPVGPNAFPILVGGIAIVCALFMVLRPDPDPVDVVPFGRHVLGMLLALTLAVGFLVIKHVYPEQFEQYNGTTIGLIGFVVFLIVFLKYLPLAAATFLLFGYALMLKPLGFLLPTFVAAGILSFQLSGRPMAALLSGLGLSWGLFILFKFILDLGLVGISEDASPYIPFIQPIIDILDSFFSWLGGMLPDFRPERTTTSGGD